MRGTGSNLSLKKPDDLPCNVPVVSPALYVKLLKPTYSVLFCVG